MTAKSIKNIDDDSYVNLLYSIGAAKKMGDTKMLESIKQQTPEVYARYEAMEKRRARKGITAKKTGKK